MRQLQSQSFKGKYSEKYATNMTRAGTVSNEISGQYNMNNTRYGSKSGNYSRNVAFTVSGKGNLDMT